VGEISRHATIAERMLFWKHKGVKYQVHCATVNEWSGEVNHCEMEVKADDLRLASGHMLAKIKR
jgi:hypothetical protein